MALVLTLVAIGVFAAAAVTDLRERRIPNALPLALALAGVARIVAALLAGAGPLAAAADVGAAAGILAAASVAFAFGLFGGGDVKLLAAGALWLGAAALLTYLTTTVLAGGLLSLAFIAWHIATRGRERGRPLASLPYGVAIAVGGILATQAFPMA